MYFLFIFILRNVSLLKGKRLKTKKKELAPIISNFLFHDEDNSVSEKKDYVKLKIEIRDALSDASFRKVLTQILMDLQKDVSGDTRKKLNELFCQLDLHHDAYKKLKSWRWEVVSQGILELTQMQVADSYNFITRFINDRRGIIRKQAEIATVSLRTEGINYFLDTTRYSISEWQQLKLMEVLKSIEDFRPPAFKAWLVSGNRDVVLFALRLIRHYNQNEAATSIIELVKHKNERIKLAAIQCIKEFCLVNALNTLKVVFPKSGQAMKIEILDTIASLGNEEDLEFLNKVEQSKSSFLVKNKAQMAINGIMPETFIPSKGILSEKDLDKAIIEQEELGDEYLNEQIRETEASVDEAPKKQIVEDLPKDVEVEVIEIEQVEKIIEPIETHKNTESVLEIGLISKELDSSMNDQIGLLDRGIDNDFEHQNIEETDGAEAFLNMNPEEKTTFVELLEETATEKDVPLVEDLMEKETDSELRYGLFNTLKTIKEEKTYDDNKPLEGIAAHSIFHELFDYAADLDSKLILLNQIVEVGDEKELPLLELLANDENPQIKKRVEKTKKALLIKLDGQVLKEKHIIKNKISKSFDEVKNEPRELKEYKYENRLSMELCFLEDLGISSSDDPLTAIDFELAEEFYYEQEKRKELRA